MTRDRPRPHSVFWNWKVGWSGLTVAGRRIFIWSVALIVALAIAVWFLFPIYLCNYLNKRGSELPDYNCHINSIQLDLLLCGITLNGVSLVKKDGKWLYERRIITGDLQMPRPNLH